MPLGTPLNDEMRNWQFKRPFLTMKRIIDCHSTIGCSVMCGLIPHYGEEMAGEKFDFQPKGPGRPGFSSAI